MPLTQTESAALMKDPIFVGRVKVCCLKYASTIIGEPTEVPAHNTRVTWAKKVFQFPDTVASEVASPTVMDPAVQANGAEITDEALQASVEVTVNKSF